MKIRAPTIPVLLLFAGSAQADYALPATKERLILLLKVDQIRIDKNHETLAFANLKHRVSINRFWMQDRIWSDGICVGVRDTEPRSALSRIKEVAGAISRKHRGSVLLELVRIHGSDDFMVAYLKLFDPASEYSRYFPKRQFYDTVDLSLPGAPKDSKKFVEALEGITRKSLERLALK